MGLLQPIGHMQQKLLTFPLGTPWEGSSTPIPPRWVRVSVSCCPFLAVWSSQAGASHLGGNCDTVLCFLMGLLLHNRPQLINQESVGPLLKDAGDLVMKDMGKAQLLNAFFALLHWRGPLSSLPNTSGWQQCLVE